MNLACYQYAIGLSRSSCNCAGAPLHYQRSDSGWYLDELGSIGKTIGGYEDCSNGGMWKALERAREAGILRFISTTNGLMAKVGVAKRANFSGSLNYGYTGAAVVTTKAYNGFSILPAPIQLGYIRLRGFGANLAPSGTVTLQVFKRTNDRSEATIELEQVGDDIPLTTVANKHTVTMLAEPIILPMYDPAVQQAEYFFAFATAGVTAKQNEFYCHCGGFRCPYDLNAPCFVGSAHWSGTRAWANWVTVGSFEVDTLDSPDTPSSVNRYGQGIYPILDIYCSPAATLCSGALDFTTNPFAGEIAEAILLASGSKLLEDTLLSFGLQRNLQANREALTRAQGKWEKLFYERAEYVATNVDLSTSDCVNCKSRTGLRTRAVLS